MRIGKGHAPETIQESLFQWLLSPVEHKCLSAQECLNFKTWWAAYILQAAWWQSPLDQALV